MSYAPSPRSSCDRVVKSEKATLSQKDLSDESFLNESFLWAVLPALGGGIYRQRGTCAPEAIEHHLAAERPCYVPGSLEETPYCGSLVRYTWSEARDLGHSTPYAVCCSAIVCLARIIKKDGHRQRPEKRLP